jgi:hypothetical protein
VRIAVRPAVRQGLQHGLRLVFQVWQRMSCIPTQDSANSTHFEDALIDLAGLLAPIGGL